MRKEFTIVNSAGQKMLENGHSYQFQRSGFWTEEEYKIAVYGTRAKAEEVAKSYGLNIVDKQENANSIWKNVWIKEDDIVEEKDMTSLEFDDYLTVSELIEQLQKIDGSYETNIKDILITDIKKDVEIGLSY